VELWGRVRGVMIFCNQFMQTPQTFLT
jgi:hypothetical protein